MPRLQQSGRGDFFVVINVVVPDTLTGEQKRLLNQMGLNADAPARPLKKTLIDSLKDFHDEG
jgi:DnaJ-class molecular chaperone